MVVVDDLLFIGDGLGVVGALSSHVGALLVGGGRCCNTAALAYNCSVVVAMHLWLVGGFSMMIGAWVDSV